MIGPTANTLFYIDSTGSFGAYAGSATLPWVLKTAFGDSLLNYEGWGLDIIDNDNAHVDSAQVPSIYMHNLKLAKASFDDSLNNAHTILNSLGLRQNATTGAVPIEALRLELTDPTIDLNMGEGPSLNFYVAESGDLRQLGAQIAGVRESISNATATTSLSFFTAADDAAPTEKMRITSAGKVGIGSTTPQHTLSMVGTAPMFNMVDSDINKVRTSAAQASDSASFKVDVSTAFPTVTLSGGDGDQYTISGNTSDQALFAGASGGYNFDGDLTYGFIHFVGSADSVAVTPTVTQYLYTKLLPGIVTHEADGVTFAADSIKILTAGDYACFISVTLSGTNANDYWRIKVFKNNAALPNTGAGSVGRFVFRTTANNQTDTREYAWYFKDLAVNDVLSWRITNLSATRNPTITDMKLYFYKLPE